MEEIQIGEYVRTYNGLIGKIVQTTEKGANTLLFKFIGNDARKWRFEVKKVEKEEEREIIKKRNFMQKMFRL